MYRPLADSRRLWLRTVTLPSTQISFKNLPDRPSGIVLSYRGFREPQTWLLTSRWALVRRPGVACTTSRTKI